VPAPRNVDTAEIAAAVRRLVVEANLRLPDDIIAALKTALAREESPRGRNALSLMLENADIAPTDLTPLCQDTGIAVVFLEIGQDVCLSGAPLAAAVDEGVRGGYADGFLRNSVAADPLFERRNTGDNTPAVLHTEIVPGESVLVTVFIKGGGSESVGAAKVVPPASGLAGFKQFVLDTVKAAGPNPCPPIIVGVGVGGTLDQAAALAKKSLLTPLDQPHPEPRLADLERELTEAINGFGFGPAGQGGKITCLGVRIASAPSHIATLPVAVDISCYCLRRASATI
jgi:fumarate hydratase subunit alpha